eukprot:TRINITY_DN6288_c0_g1_i1.p2 TRINITY_DN6288_c0_g1~~TRINITY_DN6288_c0_g1_i1.p2  ORF type:complete len:223 (-),score=78.82 TRINITY_DN6288_c0_g1_i1:219-887(-)
MAGLKSGEAEGRIARMCSEITSEASKKAAEIEAAGQTEFDNEVNKILREQKEKVLDVYAKKKKEVETRYAIAKSTSINKQRLEQVKARQNIMSKIQEDVRMKLTAEGQNKAFVTKLIVQGLLMLLEPEVAIRCREKDVQLVSQCLTQAADDYSKVILKETGVSKTCKLAIDKSKYVPSASLGGVVLACQGGHITIDNTIDLRLSLVMDQDKPAIRKLLFPTA